MTDTNVIKLLIAIAISAINANSINWPVCDLDSEKPTAFYCFENKTFVPKGDIAGGYYVEDRHCDVFVIGQKFDDHVIWKIYSRA